MDRQIVAPTHDHREARSTTPWLGQQYLPSLILNTVLEIIRKLGDPYDVKPGLSGMMAYPPMAMAAANRNKVGAPF